MLAAGLPAKQAVLFQSSRATVSAPSKDPPYAAPEWPLSFLGADAEAGPSREQTNDSGGPEGSVGCRA